MMNIFYISSGKGVGAPNGGGVQEPIERGCDHLLDGLHNAVSSK